jgi:hypothetical protein
MDGVDKRVDVIATAMHGNMTVFDLEELELAYAPPFGSSRDPINIIGFVAANALRGTTKLVEWSEVQGSRPRKTSICWMSVRTSRLRSVIFEGALHIPWPELRDAHG